MNQKRFAPRYLVASALLSVLLAGLFACGGPTEEPPVADCASLVLSAHELEQAPKVTYAPIEDLQAGRPAIDDLPISFHLQLYTHTIPVGGPIPFTLQIVNEMDQAVVLYFPREWISLDPSPGMFTLLLRDEERFGIGCPGTSDYPLDAFSSANFIELRSQGRCQWKSSLVWDRLYCPPEKLPGPGRYAVFYLYENVVVGPEVPSPDIQELVFYDVQALWGAKSSNQVEFTIVESEGR